MTSPIFATSSASLYRRLFITVHLTAIIIPMSLFTISNDALAGKTSPDPRELIGKEFVDANFSNGWKRLGDPLYDERYGVSAHTITKQGIYAFILETTLEVLDKRRNSRRWKVVDAIRLERKPGGFGGYDLTRQCIGPSPTTAQNAEDKSQIVLAEVRFKRCQRYSSRISKAWLVDMKAQRISPVSTKGMRCEDTFFNNGPDGPTCPDIAKEW